jgi:hypothetical protein
VLAIDVVFVGGGGAGQRTRLVDLGPLASSDRKRAAHGHVGGQVDPFPKHRAVALVAGVGVVLQAFVRDAPPVGGLGAVKPFPAAV